MTKEFCWKRYYFQLFYFRLKELYNETLRLSERDPDNYHKHETAKLFSKVILSIEHVSQNPMHQRYLLGKSLGEKFKDWRRDKYDLPPRYRLFFKFFSSSQREIVFAWLNDSQSLRKEGSRSDPYALFQKMLEKGEVPVEREHLKDSSYNDPPWE